MPSGNLSRVDKIMISRNENVIRLLLAGGKSKFASVEHICPKLVADFLKVTEREYRDISVRQAYEKINEHLGLLHISAWKER
jgi:hypothetical protein